MSSPVSRVHGCDVRTAAAEEHLIGWPQTETFFERAVRQNRVVVTHDLAFGRTLTFSGAPFVGIAYLRPGHIAAKFILAGGRCGPPVVSRR